ncbi:MAG: transglycosylase SLT domain-containing protein [Xanthobacteraceae bacterium]|nr:transglycosylase SLT domain-containing protein [Xanthobacteraceae bacterium]MCW5679445.1 transglycosylase SLT domain-containing protein [Xanthobacteraceae bacterium]
MLLDSLLNTGERVTAAIKSASQQTGISFDYLLKTAYRESALNPSAQASTSSAVGLFQFIDTTWLATVKEDGPSFGLQAQANQIEKTADGQYFVRDPSVRAEILALRKNPEIAANMAAAFSKRNAEQIRSVLGREPTSGELYIAHFLGANGAKRFLQLRAANPNASAASAFPEAARANKSIFYGPNGAKSVEETYRGLVAKHDNIQNVAPAAAVANLQITNPRAPDENNSPIPNLLNRIASLFLPQRSQPANAVRQLQPVTTTTATAFAPMVSPATRVLVANNVRPVTPADVQAQNTTLAYTAPQAQNDAPIFRGLFQNGPVDPISQDVRSLWGGVNPFLRRTT